MSEFQTFFFMTYYIPLDSWKWGESNGTILIMWVTWESDLHSKILHFWFGTMLIMLWLYNCSVLLKHMKFWIEWYQFPVNPSRTDGGMNILPVFCNIKKGQIFISPSILFIKIWFWYCHIQNFNLINTLYGLCKDILLCKARHSIS